jgi:hypothetical protein
VTQSAFPESKSQQSPLIEQLSPTSTQAPPPPLDDEPVVESPGHLVGAALHRLLP